MRKLSFKDVGGAMRLHMFRAACWFGDWKVIARKHKLFSAEDDWEKLGR